MRMLAPHPLSPHIGYMETTREDAVRKALELNTGSMRALAEEAGVTHGLLRMIRDGERSATPATVEKLAAALERWSERTTEAAHVLRQSLTERGEE